MNTEYIGPLVLTSVNYKRLKAVRIAFDEPGLTIIEGRNAQGKSSVLDSLLSVLLEDGQVDERPIREGEDSATVELTLTNGRKIRRTFKRSAKNAKGYTTELLLLTDEGAKLDRPAATIKEWLGSSISFDPLDFADMKATDRRALLAKMLGIDLESYDNRIRPLETKRTQHYGVYDAAKRAHENKPDLPPKVEAVDVAALNQSLTAALGRQEVIATKKQELATAERERDGMAAHLTSQQKQQQDLEAQLAGLKESIKDTEARIKSLDSAVDMAHKELVASAENAPDISTIQDELAAADSTNRRAAEVANIATQREKIDSDWLREQAIREDLTKGIEAIRDEKVKALADAKYPVEGMEFGEDDVLMNGQPFSQASQAEQIKAGIAVALAFNPKLRIIVTHDASLLDNDNLKLLHDLAKEQSCYVIGEKVSNEPGGGFYIEDGEVANASA